MGKANIQKPPNYEVTVVNSSVSPVTPEQVDFLEAVFGLGREEAARCLYSASLTGQARVATGTGQILEAFNARREKFLARHGGEQSLGPIKLEAHIIER